MASLPSKTRPGLAVDTSVSRHRAPAPQQVFPYESRTQELSFISLADIKALKKQKSISKAQQQRQQQLQDAQRQAVQRSFSDDAVKQIAREDVPPPYTRSKTSAQIPESAMHKRIKGLRPSPLDLSTDISPSDRAITIGISVDPTAVSSHSRTPSSPAASQLYPGTQPYRRPSEKYNGQEVVTPTIVITPAKEDFDFELPSRQSPEHLKSHAKGHRPTSSIYSRYTNCMPANGYTPPVPPLPLFALGKARRVRDSYATIFEEDDGGLKVPKRRQNKNLSVCTAFEEDQQPTRDVRRLTSQSLLPTPRRSRGWWNFITSPFSASSKSNVFFWQSPTQHEDGDRARMLEDPSDMDGVDAHAGIIFTNRTPDDLDLRSAPPIDSQRNDFSVGRPRQPKRCDTAPGALDINGRDGVDIYTIPYVGEAANYYNPHKNFPSVMILPDSDGEDRALDDWSLSHSVYRELPGSVKGVLAGVDDSDDSDNTIFEDNPFDDKIEPSRAVDDEKSPFSDAHASNTFQDFSGTHPAATADRKFFTTPATEELRGTSLDQPVRPEPTRNETQGTLESYFSPLTATPIIEDARMGTLMGPSVVDVTSTRVASPHASGLGAVTMASRGVNEERAVSEKAPFRLHQRNDSYGLGIETDSESMSEKSLFPPPKPLAQQPRLGTDRFGQLRIEEESDRAFYRAPWYRRFLWPLVTFAAMALILLVVLLVLFVSQGHDDMAVQAQWLNLTGFPVMPKGVSTVVQPKQVAEVGGCVQPSDLWSCAAPSGGEDTVPNFRFEVRFRNKTRSDMNATDLAPSLSDAFQASGLARRSAWSDSLYASLPAQPPKDDMVFIGNTTDEVSEPFEGEVTPFYISLLNASALVEAGSTKSRLVKREKGDGVYPYPTTSAESSSNDTSIEGKPDQGTDADSEGVSTKAANKIPRPFLRSNGQPAEAQLYPLAYAQPLRLFNRGQESEHYGFYTYFDRSIYINTASMNASDAGNSTLSGNVTSNTRLEDGNAVCVFSQTRLHVQIWTRKSTVSALNNTDVANTPAVNSTANDMTTPGSFPYPVTVTLDRHGGEAENKGVYCYGLDSEGRVLSDAKTWIAEDRGFDGTIVNAAAVPGVVSRGDLEKRDSDGDGSSGKGIDGGDGGCSCSWQNWAGR